MENRNKNKNVLDRAFLSTVITVCLIEFSQVGSSLIDGIMTSRMLGSDAMAAFGLGLPLFSIAGVISGVLALGMQSFSAKAIGRGDYRLFNEVTSATVIAGLFSSLLLTVVVVIFSGPLTRLLGARGNSAELFDLTRSYLLGFSVGFPALILGPILAPAVQLDDNGRLVRIAALLCSAADVILDYAAVRLNMGLIGMGLATAISYYVNLLVLAFHFRKKERMLHLRFRGVNMKLAAEILPGGSNMAVRRLANVVRPIVINNYVVLLGGTAAVTALSVKNNLTNFAEILGSGITGAVPLMMGVAIGEKNLEDVLHIGKLVHRFAVIGNGILVALLCVFASPIATFFLGKGSPIQPMVVFAICMMSIELLSQTLISSRISYLNVISRFSDSRLLQLSMRLLAVVPCVLIFGSVFGVYGVLSSTAMAYLLLMVVIYLVCALRNRNFKLKVEDYLRLDDSFDLSPGDVIELDIRDMDDAALVAEQIQMFCKGHKLDKKRGYYAALAMEETARLIFENNGFSPDTAIDLRVVIQNDDLILRIRDNGKSSYPFGGLDSSGESEDPVSNFGIRMLRRTARDISCFHTLKINYTIITV